MIVLKIADTAIRTDASGRYCLNDLHRASGAKSKHQPSNWLRTQQVLDLLAEIGRSSDSRNGANQPLSVHQGGSGLQGTFVAKELVYAYAMWISPAFHLKVIRAYDAMVAQPAAPAVPQTLPEALRLAADLAEQKAEAEAALAIAAPKAAALDRIAVATDGAVNLRQAAKLVQVPERQFIAFLQQQRWIYKNPYGKPWLAYSEFEANGYLEMKRVTLRLDDGDEKVQPQTLVTPRGLTKIGELIERKAPHLRKYRPGRREGAGVSQPGLPGVH